MSNIVEIRNVELINNGGKIVGHKFDVVVEDASADGNAKVQWFERTDRKYAALAKNETWEDLFEKFCTYGPSPNLFTNAYEALPEETEEGTKVINFIIHDEPSVTIDGIRTRTSEEDDKDSRRLDFIILVQLTEKDIYVAICRQIIDVDEKQKKLRTAEFKTTGFKKVEKEEAERIRMEVNSYHNSSLSEIFEGLGF